MAGRRQPTDVVEANGRKHLTNEEKDARRDAEIRIPLAKSAEPPKWLKGKTLREEFCRIGEALIGARLYTDLDADTLAHYVVARKEWLLATKQVDAALKEKNGKAAEGWTKIQDRFFKQARSCAADLGLSLSARCRLVVPQTMRDVEDPEEEDEFTKILRQRQRGVVGR